jgi:hypothetical protein
LAQMIIQSTPWHKMPFITGSAKSVMDTLAPLNLNSHAHYCNTQISACRSSVDAVCHREQKHCDGRTGTVGIAGPWRCWRRRWAPPLIVSCFLWEAWISAIIFGEALASVRTSWEPFLLHAGVFQRRRLLLLLAITFSLYSFKSGGIPSCISGVFGFWKAGTFCLR